MALTGWLAKLERAERLDVGVGALRELVAIVPSEVRDVLRGRWLGHPLHPALTDLPIGFWTSAWVLDVVGGRRSSRAATALVGLGVVTAAPAAAAGLADWGALPREAQRVGVVHAASNLAATTLYAASFTARCRGRRGRGIVLGMVGAGVATLGGYLGGHLAFGIDEEADEPVVGVPQVGQ